MKRAFDAVLDKWKDDPNRLPLIVRGARQVGKSFTIEGFGQRLFENVVTLNFEKTKNAEYCFEKLDPRIIIQEIELILNQKIIPGKTLLFLDEIQDCPQAITALRYFKEEMPELHVIAAGSLLEFVLNDESFSFPVGRVQFMYMRPLSFLEFLEVNNLLILRNYLETITLQNTPSLQIHQELIKQIRLYMIVGGMPAVVRQFVADLSLLSCRQQQDTLLDGYRQDFAKYASKAQHRYLQRLFERAPDFVGSHVRYSKIDPEAANPAREYKQAIRLLSNAGLIHTVKATGANGLPLRAEVSEKKFKLLFLDVGLLLSAMEVDPSLYTFDFITALNKGAVAEQYVGQELLACSSPHRDTKLYFWERQETGSEAQVDYLMPIGDSIIPIEVKSYKTGKLKSLRLFMDEKRSPYGIKISEAPLSFNNNILSVPFYMIPFIDRLLNSEKAIKHVR